MKPRPDALRKHLQRCIDQGLVVYEKGLGGFHYKIAVKGRERLRRVRAKRNVDSEKWVADGTKKPAASPADILGKREDQHEREERRLLVRRMFEVVSSRKLCDAVLSGARDRYTLKFARTASFYWEREYAKLIPT